MNQANLCEDFTVFDLLLLEDFLDPPTRDAVLTGARQAAGAAATVSGQGKSEAEVSHRVRHSMQLAVSGAIRELVDRRLTDLKPELCDRFDVELTRHEPLQFLRYEPGGYFVAHQDGNTPLTRDRTLHRRVSIVIFLNSQTPESAPNTGNAPGAGAGGGYTGGELVFHAPYPDVGKRQSIAGAAGALVAFPSETTHEVMMVTGGERYTIATWFRTDGA